MQLAVMVDMVTDLSFVGLLTRENTLHSQFAAALILYGALITTTEILSARSEVYLPCNVVDTKSPLPTDAW